MITTRSELLCTPDLDYETRVQINNILDRHNVKELDNVVTDLLYYFMNEYHMGPRLDAIEDELESLSRRIDTNYMNLVDDVSDETTSRLRERLEITEKHIKKIGDTNRLLDDMETIYNNINNTRNSIKSYVTKLQGIAENLLEYMSSKKNLNIRRNNDKEEIIPQKIILKLRQANEDLDWTK